MMMIHVTVINHHQHQQHHHHHQLHHHPHHHRVKVVQTRQCQWSLLQSPFNIPSPAADGDDDAVYSDEADDDYFINS